MGCDWLNFAGAGKVSQGSGTLPGACLHFQKRFFFNFLFGNLPGCGFQPLKFIHLLKTPLLPARICLLRQAPLLYCSSPGHTYIPSRVSRARWIFRRSELHVPSQPWGSCCGRPHWGNQYPRLHSIFLCHGSVAKDRVLFPSSLPLAPNAVPSLLPGLHTPPQDLCRAVAPSTQQINGRGGGKNPHNHCKKSQQ